MSEDDHITLEDMIRTLNLIADFIEVETKDHTRNVREIARAIGSEMKWEGKELVLLGYGADIHDIGKIAINPTVLRQPTKLTKAQTILVRQHPEFGVEMLRYSKAPKIVKDCVMYHHEHDDGSGYPLGIRGEAIPMCASIVCVADVWESITTDRPYHRAMEHGVALDEMNRCHAWFNNRVYTAFLSLINRGDL